MRFYQSLYLFNDANYRHIKGKPIEKEVLLASAAVTSGDREPFVSIVAFCLMRNHFHLLLKQRTPGGISKFLHKIGMGYARYLNTQVGRTGRLFESTYKAVPADAVDHLRVLPRYIHLNALDSGPIDWRHGLVEPWEEVSAFLNKYPWSSHEYYRNRVQDLPVVDETEVDALFTGVDMYLDYLRSGPSLSDGLRY